VTPAALAVDAGQTEIRAALTGERGPRRSTAPGVLRLGGAVVADGVAAGLLEAVAGLGPLPSPPPPLGIGLSGFEAAGEQDLRRLAELLRHELGAESVVIASDGVTALLGALGEQPGAVVATGTGAVCVARRGDRFAKVDGWGSLLGDAGSGFAIGRAGLDAALRRVDGRGGSLALLRAAEERFCPAPDLAERIYGAPVPTRTVASFAADVARVAAEGDEAAQAILRDAARELAISACAALDRLFPPAEEALVSYAGNVFEAGVGLSEPFARAVVERRPRTAVVAPQGDPLAGAALLARRGQEFRPEPGILWKTE
jgi:N-acetylmuramic acid 6-phosphate etherase